MGKELKIGVCKKTLWDKGFYEALDRKLMEKKNFSYSIIDINRSDWIEQIRPFDIIIWRSPWMGRLSQHYKEKIFLIQHHLNKKVIPNWESIWHFDSKIAQYFLFEYHNIKLPRTFVTFDYSEAIDYVKKCNYPQILKLSSGSASNNVKMLKNQKEAIKELRKHFAKTFFWEKLSHWQYFDHQMFGSMYLQEFVPNNDSDLRITVIGDRYAFAFWRKNRENDFRASGSGKINYEKEIPEEPLNYCLEISKKLNFDSMAYDIIFDKNKFLITEISYGYNQDAIYKAPGYYKKISNNKLIFIKGHYWPQYLWIEWLFDKYEVD